jgi:hypothetical protein
MKKSLRGKKPIFDVTVTATLTRQQKDDAKRWLNLYHLGSLTVPKDAPHELVAAHHSMHMVRLTTLQYELQPNGDLKLLRGKR